LGGLLNFRSLCGRLLRVLVFGPRHRDCLAQRLGN
jgi:hypothetical protein